MKDRGNYILAKTLILRIARSGLVYTIVYIMGVKY